MMPDDDSLLSAYLDGQLGPEEQQAVEAALAEEPRLLEELRGLAALRDLLAGLPREAPVDLTSRVMRRVRRRAMLGKARGIIAWGPVRAAGLVAVAAAILAVLVVPWLPHVGGPAAPGGAEVAAVDGHAPRPRPGPSDSRWPAFSHAREHATATAATGPAADGPSRPQPAQAEGDAPGELLHVREYLDHPQLRHIFLVSDPGDGSDERRVADVVEQTTRFNYYKITISQGIVLDPRHPDRATVFALVVGPRELDSLRSRLRAALDDRVEEQPAEPGVVTRLADIGHVEACAPVPAAEMRIPREALAYKDGAAGPAVEAPEPPESGPPAPVRGPTREQEYSSPAAELVDRSLVVLVWVSRPNPG